MESLLLVYKIRLNGNMVIYVSHESIDCFYHRSLLWY